MGHSSTRFRATAALFLGLLLLLTLLVVRPAAALAEPTPWTSVGVGRYHVCALRAPDQVYCWGRGTALGNGGLFSPSPTLVTGRWRALSVGEETTCAIATSGRLSCWGNNQSGQLGVGDSADRYRPTPVVGRLTWRSVTVGADTVCAIATNRSLYCWGGGGTTGNGGYIDRWIPQRIGSRQWQSVSAGRDASCGIRLPEAHLRCWGHNALGSVGDGTTAERRSPVGIGTSAWSDVSVGTGVACGHTADATLRCWGTNKPNGVGDGTTESRHEPTEVDVSEVSGTIGAVVVGDRTTCGVSSSNEVYCWGVSYPAGVERDDPSPWLRPRLAAGGTADWTAVSVFEEIGCGIRSSGRLFCWGNNWNGQFGNGETGGESFTPVPVGDV